MNLVKITHRRCGDHSGNTFILAPEEWSRSEISERVERAQDAYLRAVAMDHDEKPPYPSVIDLAGLPESMTVGEVRADKRARQQAYDDWYKRHTETHRAFEIFLLDEGFFSLWDAPTATTDIEVDWKHRHGMLLSYGNEKTIDDMPKPVVLATGEDPEEW